MSHIDITFLGKGYGCPSYSDIPEIPGKILVKEKKKKIRQTIIKTIKNINEKRRKKKIKAKRKKTKTIKNKTNKKLKPKI